MRTVMIATTPGPLMAKSVSKSLTSIPKTSTWTSDRSLMIAISSRFVFVDC